MSKGERRKPQRGARNTDGGPLTAACPSLPLCRISTSTADRPFFLSVGTAGLPEKKPAASDSAAEVRERINGITRKNLPELTKVYNEAMKKEPQKEKEEENKLEKKASC